MKPESAFAVVAPLLLIPQLGPVAPPLLSPGVREQYHVLVVEVARVALKTALGVQAVVVVVGVMLEMVGVLAVLAEQLTQQQ